MTGQSALVEDNSPLQTLNNRFSNQNAEIESFVGRLRQRLHKLSDTNVPMDNSPKACESEKLPFNDGQLMSYHIALNNQSRLIYELQDQVIKLESLV